jgi:D-alanyl-D-alanine carboxypeptidase (penicillin-binding protein 5/6)
MNCELRAMSFFYKIYIAKPKRIVYKTSDVHLIIAIICLFLIPCSLSAREGVTASSFLLVEKETFQVISGRDYDHKHPPASTTKVLTTIVALEQLQGNETIVPDKAVLNIPASKLNLIPGKQYQAIDLIKATMIKSANDAAYTLASHIGGSEELFTKMMNEKARSIGAHDSNFKNASGLFVEGQYSTCWDLALMFRYALESDNFRNIVATRYFLFNDSKRSVRYMNHNRLLFCFEPTIGGKTGFTRASKHCYVGAFEKEGRVYILSMLGSKDLWGDAVKILEGLYSDLPSDREIRLAKSSSLTLTSYKPSKSHKLHTKKSTVKKKTVKYSKGAKKAARR